MAEYQFGSILDRNFRLTLQKLADELTVHGKTIQDLVADGQLTAQQYGELIYYINGLVGKGEITIDDLNKENFKLDQTFLSEELLQQMAGTTPINSVPADGSVSFLKLSSELNAEIQSKADLKTQKDMGVLSVKSSYNTPPITNALEIQGNVVPTNATGIVDMELKPNGETITSLKIELMDSGVSLNEVYVGRNGMMITLPNNTTNVIYSEDGAWKMKRRVSDKHVINDNSPSFLIHSTGTNNMLLRIPRSKLEGITTVSGQGLAYVEGKTELVGTLWDEVAERGKYTTNLSSNYVDFIFDKDYNGLAGYEAAQAAREDLQGTEFYYQLQNEDVVDLPYFGNAYAYGQSEIVTTPVIWGYMDNEDTKTITTNNAFLSSVKKVVRYDFEKGNLITVDVTSDAEIMPDLKTIKVNNFEADKIYFYECDTDIGTPTFDIKQRVALSNEGGSSDFATPSDYNGDVHAALASGKKVLIPQGESYVIDKPLEPSNDTVIELNGTLKIADAVIQNLASNISSGSNTISVVDGSAYRIGQWVGVTDDNQKMQGGGDGLVERVRREGEVGKIIDISGNTLTIQGTFKSNFTTAANAKVGTMNSGVLVDTKENVLVTGIGLLNCNGSTQLSINPVSTELTMEEVRAGCGLTSHNSHNVIFDKIRVEDAALHNVVLGGRPDQLTTYSKVAGVKTKRAHDKNILTFFTDNCDLIDNIADDAIVEDGISAHMHNTNLRLRGNKARNNPRFGIYLRDESHYPKIDDNLSADNYINYQLDIDGATGDNNTSVGGKHSTFANLIRNKDNTLTNFNILNIGEREGLFLTGENNKVRGGEISGNTNSYGAISIGENMGTLPKNVEVSGVTFKDNQKAIRLVDGDGARILDNNFEESNITKIDDKYNATNTLVSRNIGVVDS